MRCCQKRTMENKKKKKLREMTQEEKREYWNMRYWKERPARLVKWRQKNLERSKEEKERLKAYQKLWRERNKEYVATKRRARYEKEREYERRRRRERYALHREEILEKLKEKRRNMGGRTYAARKQTPPPPPPPTPQVYETSLKELFEDLFPSLLDVFCAHNEIHDKLHLLQ